jgi:hypothetical protein
VLLDDPKLIQRSPGQEFARAHAQARMDACVVLHESITTRFPLFKHRPRLTVRDLMKVAVTTSAEVTYAREMAGGEDVPITSAGTAPEARFDCREEVARIGPIRARLPVPRSLLADPATLAALVDYRLLVRLCTAENGMLLHGLPEVGIRGLLETPGLRRQEPRGGVAETILAAASRCEHFGGSADGIVMNPADWWPLVGAGGFLAGLNEAGIRINRTRLMPERQALVGDFQAGATVLDRQTGTIRLSPGDGDQVLLEGEVLEGLAVHLPGHFVLTAFR